MRRFVPILGLIMAVVLVAAGAPARAGNHNSKGSSGGKSSGMKFKSSGGGNHLRNPGNSVQGTKNLSTHGNFTPKNQGNPKSNVQSLGGTSHRLTNPKFSGQTFSSKQNPPSLAGEQGGANPGKFQPSKHLADTLQKGGKLSLGNTKPEWNKGPHIDLGHFKPLDPGIGNGNGGPKNGGPNKPGGNKNGGKNNHHDHTIQIFGGVCNLLGGCHKQPYYPPHCVCPPSPPVIVNETLVVVNALGTSQIPVAQLPRVPNGSRITLFVPQAADQFPGRAVLMVGDQALPLNVVGWQTGAVTVELPTLLLPQETLVRVYVADGAGVIIDGQDLFLVPIPAQ